MRGRWPRCPENAAILTVLHQLEEENSASLDKLRAVRKARRSLEDHHSPVGQYKDFCKVPGVGPWIATTVWMRLPSGWAAQNAAAAAVRRLEQARQQAGQQTPPLQQAAPVDRPRQLQVNSGATVLQDSDEEVPPDTTSSGRGRGRSRCRGRSRAASRRPNRPYRPQYRSAPYAVLIALLRAAEDEGRDKLGKQDLATLAQPFADQPILMPGTDDPRTWYNGWSGINKQLVQKGLVKAWSNPKWFALTNEGRELAEELWRMQESAVARTADEYGQVVQAEGEGQEEQDEHGEPQEQREPRNRQDVGEVRRRYNIQLSGVSEFGLPGDAGIGNGASSGTSRHENAGVAGIAGGKRFSAKQVERSVAVIEKLERDGQEREECMEVLRGIFEKCRFPRTEDKLYEEMADALWKRRQREAAAGRSNKQVKIRQSSREIAGVDDDALDATGSPFRRDPPATENARYGSGTQLRSPQTSQGICHKSATRAYIKDGSKGVLPSLVELPRQSPNVSPPGLPSLGELSSSPALSRRSKPTSISNNRGNAYEPPSKAPIAIIHLDDDSSGADDIRMRDDPPGSQDTDKSPRKRPRSSGSTFSPRAKSARSGSGSTVSPQRSFFLDDVTHVGNDDTSAVVEAQPMLQRQSPKDLFHVREVETAIELNVHNVTDGTSGENGTERCIPWLSGPGHDGALATEEPNEVIDVTAERKETVFDEPEEVDVITSAENVQRLPPMADLAAQANIPCRVVLIIDSMERVRRRARVHELDTMKTRLLDQGVDCEVRQLPCGDALFIARYSNDVEVVLDYLIERKTLEDFDASLRDGRERRQSFLMRQSQIPRRMFLLEGDMRFHPDLADNTRFSNRIAEIEMCENFYVKRTKDLNDTIWFYSSMYKRLKAEYAEQPVARVTTGRSLFHDWNRRMKDLAKGITLKQLFMLQLCQVHGVGKESAMSILRSGCETPWALFEKLQSIQGSEERQKLFAGEDSVNSRTARTLCRLFTATDYGTEPV